MNLPLIRRFDNPSHDSRHSVVVAAITMTLQAWAARFTIVALLTIGGAWRRWRAGAVPIDFVTRIVEFIHLAYIVVRMDEEADVVRRSYS